MAKPAQTFHGKPCKVCESTQRYASNLACVPCSKKRLLVNRDIQYARRVRDHDAREAGAAEARRLALREQEYAASAALRVPSIFHMGTPGLTTFTDYGYNACSFTH